ncbi:MAG TPA: caspase family protein [Steroidobacteraceae bacterium]|nr:caspase family protein [Steroidobacteraceae bacterium]
MKRLTHYLTVATFVAMAIAAPTPGAAAQQRIALVIGNSAYASGLLPNPANDARLVHDTLEQLGFRVIERTNADQATMKRAIQDFGASLDKAGSDAVGLFYYAGHGVQLNGRNYLIPTKANIDREGDLEIEAVSADWVIEEMRLARNGLNIVILDACRNNPFVRGMRSADRGLAIMDAPTGILIAYSTAPGTVAEDGAGRNSPYTTALTDAMLNLHEPLETLFKHVRVNVMGATQGKQVPWEYSSLIGADFYFKEASRPAVAVTTAPVTTLPAAGAQPAGSGTGASESWLSDVFASSLHRLVSLFSSGTPPAPASAKLTPPASGAGTVAAGAVPAPEGPEIAGARVLTLFNTLGIEAAGIDAQHSYQMNAVRQLLESAPRHVSLGSTAEQIRAATSLCRQYSPYCDYSDERLRSRVLQPFELDPLPVSVRAFRQFAEAAHYRTHAERVGFAYATQSDGVTLEEVPGGSWRNAVKRHPADDDTPVVGVAFQDAVAYCHSINSRLPSEDEWEYVARGPERNVFPWGGDDPAPVSRALTVPPRVTDGPPEGIGGGYKGLSGSVWQWVDTSIYTHLAATKSCACKVLKGGSWLETNPANKRAATRRYGVPDRADEDSGFRCARSTTAWPDAALWMGRLR